MFMLLIYHAHLRVGCLARLICHNHLDPVASTPLEKHPSPSTQIILPNVLHLWGQLPKSKTKCATLLFVTKVFKCIVWSYRLEFIFWGKELQKLSFWWHAFPINISFNAKEPIQIIFACVFPNSINFAIAYHLCQDTGYITITQTDHVWIFSLMQGAKIMIWVNSQIWLSCLPLQGLLYYLLSASLPLKWWGNQRQMM